MGINQNDTHTILFDVISLVKENTEAFTNINKTLSIICENISKLPQMTDSKLQEKDIHEIKSKIEDFLKYVNVVQNIPYENKESLKDISILLTNFKNEIYNILSLLTDIENKIDKCEKLKIILENIEEIRKQLSNLNIINDIYNKLNEFDKWSKIKFPFIMGMITFIIWSISTFFLISNIEEKVLDILNPSIKKIEMMEQQIIDKNK